MLRLRLLRPASASRDRFLLTVAALATCAALSWLILTGSTPLGLLLAAAPLLVVAVLKELERISDPERPPWGLIAIVALLPFFQLVLGSQKLHFAWQACSLVVVLAYIAAMEPARRRDTLRSALPLLVAFEVLALTGVLTLYVTGALDSHSILSAAVFGLSGAYVLVGAVLRSWAGTAEEAVRVLIYGGLLQLPVVAAQALGLTVGLAGGLSQLSSMPWGGAVGLTGIVRYPGSFGDYELFAEWTGVLFILAVGGTMYTRGRTRTLLSLTTAALLGMGLLTATRGFLVAAAFAAVVVVPGALLSRSGRSLKGLLATAGAICAAFFLVPETAVTGSVTRLMETTFTGANAFNRMELFTRWWRLVERMPWFGYGWGSAKLLNAFSSFGVQFPHSLYFYFALTAGWPGIVALAVFIAIVVLSARGSLTDNDAEIYRVLVLGVAIVYWAVSEAKIEFVRLVFYGDLLLILFGVVAADRWRSLKPTTGRTESEV